MSYENSKLECFFLCSFPKQQLIKTVVHLHILWDVEPCQDMKSAKLLIYRDIPPISFWFWQTGYKFKSAVLWRSHQMNCSFFNTCTARRLSDTFCFLSYRLRASPANPLEGRFLEWIISYGNIPHWDNKIQLPDFLWGLLCDHGKSAHL